MQEQENKLFKLIVNSGHDYFLPDDGKSIDQKIIDLQEHTVEISDKEYVTRIDEDICNIYWHVEEQLEKFWIEIKKNEVMELFNQFRSDIAPTYVIKN